MKLKFTGEESNYFVLKQVLKALKNGVSSEDIILPVEEFLAPKDKISKELELLRAESVKGSEEAADENPYASPESIEGSDLLGVFSSCFDWLHSCLFLVFSFIMPGAFTLMVVSLRKSVDSPMQWNKWVEVIVMLYIIGLVLRLWLISP